MGHEYGISAGDSSTAARLPRALTFETFVFLVAVRLALMLGGFKRGTTFVKKAARSLRVQRGEGIDPRRLALTVARVAALFPGRARCLEQALTLALLLGRRGINAELVISVTTAPFRAHAWLEVDGLGIRMGQPWHSRITPMRISM